MGSQQYVISYFKGKVANKSFFLILVIPTHDFPQQNKNENCQNDQGKFCTG